VPDPDEGPDCPLTPAVARPVPSVALLPAVPRRLGSLEKGLLRGLLGESTVAERAHGDGIHQSAVLTVDRPYGIGVAIAKPSPRGPVNH
jgi:hypothetical protein